MTPIAFIHTGLNHFAVPHEQLQNAIRKAVQANTLRMSMLMPVVPTSKNEAIYKESHRGINVVQDCSGMSKQFISGPAAALARDPRGGGGVSFATAGATAWDLEVL
eukprot:CAMPEP_0182496428 /NCGR_PEP_ID=MMETSP1321-20130603/5072_1 /TAXON_ID=91990 /ORGANISM="Bolidomonas sp., Strain RCC1657" /LENGTH=105 /DNA_ID=CAMNT_0024700045 /DNA_START=248 /DNA_END=565 /DNA_ORIENTATION=+